MGFLRSRSDSGEAQRAGARERARMRRRLRRQRQMREALLLDLGALVFELQRHGRREPELLQAKAAELSAVDEEVRALAEALGSDHTIMQLVATGVAGSCENCGSLLSVDARYCASCGAPAVPALAGDGERRAFGPGGPPHRYAALSGGAPQQAEPDDSKAETRIPDPEAAAGEEYAEAGEEYAAAGQGYEPGDERGYEPEDDGQHGELPPEPGFEEGEEPTGAEDYEEPPGGEDLAEPEGSEDAPPGEDVGQPEESEHVARPQTEDQYGEQPAFDPQRTRPYQQPGGPPPTPSDDALDSATKAIRTGITRVRNTIRGRRSEG